jgi:hypothetical protein
MQETHYLDLNEARQLLASIGRDLNERQMKRAAEPNACGQRKLPFFPDPISGKLIIEKNALLSIYTHCEVHAENNALLTPSTIRKSFEPRP